MDNRRLLSSLSRILWGIIAFGILGGIWEILVATGLWDSNILPPPTDFLQHLWDPWRFLGGIPKDTPVNPHLFVLSATGRSMARVLGGLLLGVLVAVPLGLVLGLKPWASRIATPILTFLAPLSPVAWIPFVMVVEEEDSIFCRYVEHCGNTQAVTVVFLSVIFLLTLAMTSAVRGVDRDLLQRARSLGANKVKEIGSVILPASMPSVFLMLRINFFAAWMALLIAEGVGLSQETWGLGTLIWQARQTSNASLALAAMVVVAAAGLALDRCLVAIQRRILWWRRDLVEIFE